MMNLYGTMKVNSDGILNIGGIKTTDLIQKYGTPLLVIDEKELMDNIDQYNNSFAKYYSNYKVVYGGKTFLNRTICKILGKKDMGLDVVSGGELFIAIKAGFPASDILFHGNNKLQDEIEMALQYGIGRFIIDNQQEAQLVNRLAGKMGKKVNAILRVAPGIKAHTHEYIVTGHLDSKFGVSFAGGMAREVLKKYIIEFENLNITGIHAHIGSQIFDLESYQKLIEVLFEFLEKVRQDTGEVLTELDLGGGLGVPYLRSDNPPSIAEFVRIITEAVKNATSEYNYPLPRIIVEPGRSIIGTAGTTLYQVGSIKQVPGNSKYIAVDGGMTDNIRPALYNANYEAILANRCYDEKEDRVNIAGKCCESGDILIKGAELPSANRGDILAITVTGAYTYSMASNYNGIPRPAVVLVKDGEDNLINKRESYEDLLRNDIVPSHYQ